MKDDLRFLRGASLISLEAFCLHRLARVSDSEKHLLRILREISDDLALVKYAQVRREESRLPGVRQEDGSSAVLENSEGPVHGGSGLPLHGAEPLRIGLRENGSGESRGEIVGTRRASRRGKRGVSEPAGICECGTGRGASQPFCFRCFIRLPAHLLFQMCDNDPEKKRRALEECHKLIKHWKFQRAQRKMFQEPA